MWNHNELISSTGTASASIHSIEFIYQRFWIREFVHPAVRGMDTSSARLLDLGFGAFVSLDIPHGDKVKDDHWTYTHSSASGAGKLWASNVAGKGRAEIGTMAANAAARMNTTESLIWTMLNKV